MGKSDIFKSIDELPSEATQKVIDRLEFRGKNPVFINMRDTYLNRSAIPIHSTMQTIATMRS
jgi:hypothetical protein